MSINHGLSRAALLLAGALFLPGSGAVGRDADRATELNGSFFGQTVAAPAITPAGVEFRGVVREGNVWLVNLHQIATKRSHWIPVGGEAGGLVVTGYDEATGRVALIHAGRPVLLSLKQSRMALQGDNTPLKRLSPAERITEAESPDMPGFMRDLPPEARKLLEEARRRRAIRWPAMPVEGIAPPLHP